MKVIIVGNSRRELTLANLAAFPRFLRFNDVKLFFERGPRQFVEKCRSIEVDLQTRNDALSGSKFILFWSDINQNHNTRFIQDSMLLNNLSEQLLPVSNSSCRYEFEIGPCSDMKNASNVISSILQTLSRCSNLCIRLNRLGQSAGKLPAEAISDWLTRKMEKRIGTPSEILLKICLSHIKNVGEICDFLALVSFI